MNHPQPGDLEVWWIPQIPGKAFKVGVPDQNTAVLLLDTLAAYDEFQLQEGIKPDFCNAGGVCIWEGGEWLDLDEDELREAVAS